MDILGFVIIKNIWCFKGYHQESGDNPQNGKEISVKHISDLGYYLEYRKKLNTQQEKDKSKVGNI